MLGLALMVTLAAPRAEVLALLEQQVAAWNRGDLEAFCAVYADDAVFVSPPRPASADGGVAASDGVTRGRKQVLARYLSRYPDTRAMGSLRLEPLDVRDTKDGVSVAARWTLTYPDKPAASGNTVVVLTRVKGRWQIVHDASM